MTTQLEPASALGLLTGDGANRVADQVQALVIVGEAMKFSIAPSKSGVTLGQPLRPLGMTCPACGGTMVPHGDRYKCAACGALL